MHTVYNEVIKVGGLSQFRGKITFFKLINHKQLDTHTHTHTPDSVCVCVCVCVCLTACDPETSIMKRSDLGRS